jgi:uncharacterized membrane protein
METNRLEAFSDGVITIMVLEMKVPHGTDLSALAPLERWPTVFYGINLLCCAVAYYVLQTCIIRHQGPESLLAKAVSGDFKGKASPVLYVCGILTAWAVSAWAGMAFFVFVALMWLVPDRRVERVMVERSK